MNFIFASETVGDEEASWGGEAEKRSLYDFVNSQLYAQTVSPPLLATANAESYAWMATEKFFRKHWPKFEDIPDDN
jgi:hypothetical protein